MLDVIIPARNCEKTIGGLVRSLLLQQGRGEKWGQIIVVDDASVDSTYQVLVEINDSALTVIRNARCGGRSNARNIGAAQSNAAFLLFLDADLSLVDDNLLLRHSNATHFSKFSCCWGRIDGVGNDFWARFARKIARDRAQLVAKRDWLSITSCNLSVSRAAFDAIGGFCSEYSEYGFEDRDLIASLIHLDCSFQYDDQAIVLHRGEADLRNFCLKMQQAGQYTAPIFRKRFPECYRRLNYWQLDYYANRGVPRLALSILAAGYPALEWIGSRVIKLPYVPFALCVLIVRAATGAAFVRGTKRAMNDSRRG